MASFSKFKVLVAQSCPTLCNCLDRSLLDSSVHGILQARIVTGGGSHSLHGIFPTQESNLSLLHCRQILYQLSYEGSHSFLNIEAIAFLNIEKERQLKKPFYNRRDLSITEETSTVWQFKERFKVSIVSISENFKRHL